MTRILTVDDSRAIRSIVTKQVTELGYEVGEAEDGEKGLLELAKGPYDLVLLDVTMPVLDGPGMLREMRARGDNTPVIALTSESKKSIIAELIRLGISDYILKPFKTDELFAKIQKVLATAPPKEGQPAAPVDEKRPHVDLLCIDDMENVHKKLRSLLPEAMTMDAVVDAATAHARCKEKAYRTVLVDTVIPGVDSVALMLQLKTTQPRAVFVALPLKTQTGATEEAIAKGYAGVLLKPFDGDSVNELLEKFLDSGEPTSVAENVVKALPFAGKPDPVRFEKYFSRIHGALKTTLPGLAEACFDTVILDVTELLARPDRVPRLVIETKAMADASGLQLKLVGTEEIQKILSGFTDTSTIPFFVSLPQAQAAA